MISKLMGVSKDLPRTTVTRYVVPAVQYCPIPSNSTVLFGWVSDWLHFFCHMEVSYNGGTPVIIHL